MRTQVIMAVATGGALGALARFWLATWLRDVTESFPLGTFLVNLLGCFLFGLVWATQQAGWPRPLSVGVLVGFLGAFMTFSTFAFESVTLLERGQWWAMLGNLLGQNVLGCLGVVAGMALGRAL